jgi:Ca-activated chloride channel family protein
MALEQRRNKRENSMIANHYNKMLNIPLFLLTLAAGILWGFAGEWFIGEFNKVNSIPLVGIYYTALFVLTTLACLVSELFIEPESLIPGRFLHNFTLPKLIFSAPVSITMVFTLACLFQFIYSCDSDITRTKTPPQIIEEYEEVVIQTGFDDFYFIIDDSGSLTTNDPKNIRIGAINKLVDNLSEDKRISLISFGHERSGMSKVLQKMTTANEDGKKEFKNFVSRFDSGGPTTDIIDALEENKEILAQKAGRSSMVVLITDGANSESKYDNLPYPESEEKIEASYDDIIEFYKNINIPVYVIFIGTEQYGKSIFDIPALLGLSPIQFLEDLSGPTGGKVTLIENMENFENELIKIVTTQKVKTVKQAGSETKIQFEQLRNLLFKRTDKKQNSSAYAFMRIVLIAFIGLLFGFGISFVFQYRDLIVPFCIGGGVSGILAGLLMEFGLRSGLSNGSYIRGFHDILLSTMLWTIVMLSSLIADKVFGIQWLVAFSSGSGDGGEGTAIKDVTHQEGLDNTARIRDNDKALVLNGKEKKC